MVAALGVLARGDPREHLLVPHLKVQPQRLDAAVLQLGNHVKSYREAVSAPAPAARLARGIAAAQRAMSGPPGRAGSASPWSG